MVDRGTLTIEGNKVSETTEDTSKDVTVPGRVTYHRGISARSFKKSFTLPEYSEVKELTLENGLLSIRIVKETPEAEKPKVLQIK